MNYYILKNKKPHLTYDHAEWLNFRETGDGVVLQETIGDTFVSTVFLAIGFALDKSDSPILFETMVFGGENDGHTRRYSTWEEAEIGHSDIVKMVKENSGKQKAGLNAVVQEAQDLIDRNQDVFDRLEDK